MRRQLLPDLYEGGQPGSASRWCLGDIDDSRGGQVVAVLADEVDGLHLQDLNHSGSPRL